MKLSSDLEFLEETLDLSGKELSRRFGSNLEIKTKPDAGIVTDADLASEKLILERIKKYYPDDAIISEEAGIHAMSRQQGQMVWIIDPLDGTTNFANRYPFFCVSIARAVINGTGGFDVVLGGVEEPVARNRFLAERGSGAFKNNQKLTLSGGRRFSKTFLVTGFSYKTGEDLLRDIKLFSKVADRCQSIRRDGAAALDLAYVAAGVYDAFWECGLQLWDMAAGVLLIEEAGGVLKNYQRQPERFNLEAEGLIAGVEGTVNELSDILQPCFES